MSQSEAVTPAAPISLTLRNEHNLAAFCDPESVRYAFGSIYYNPARREIVATDSRMLAIVPVKSGPAEPMLIPAGIVEQMAGLLSPEPTEPEMWSCSARKEEVRIYLQTGKRRHGEPEISIVADESDATFPNYSDLVQAKQEPIFRLSPRLLKVIAEHASQLGDAHGAYGGDVELEFQMPKDAVSAIRIDCNIKGGPEGIIYLVMPLKEQ